MAQETIKVEGMSCGHCQMAVRKAVESVEGVQKADINLQNKQVVVEYDEGKTNLEKVKTAIKEAGYNTLNNYKNAKIFLFCHNSFNIYNF